MSALKKAKEKKEKYERSDLTVWHGSMITTLQIS
jgi:hypothetical protein